MKIHQLFAHNELRNFYYIVEFGSGNAYCIDPWDGPAIETFLQEKKLLLKGVINTHEHHDHIRGNEYLFNTFNIPIYAHYNALDKIPNVSNPLNAGDKLELEDGKYFLVLDTPGHTMAHLCLALIEGGETTSLFSGDTLMNAGVGNCHRGGSPEVLYRTIVSQIDHLGDEIILYPGHDYLKGNLGFTLSVEPSNKKAQELLMTSNWKDWESGRIVSNLGLEREISLFFRLKSREVTESLDGEEDLKKKFIKLRALRDQW